MNYKLLFLLLILPFWAQSQNSMQFRDNQQYQATNSWTFISENYALTGEVKIQIAKAEKGGILKIAVNSTNPEFIIMGTVYIYLSDNTILTCLDKGMFKNSTDTISSYFIFTTAEMQLLKKTNIQAIRFNIAGKSNSFSSQIGNFTAINKKSFYTTTYDKELKIYETAKEIKSLY